MVGGKLKMADSRWKYGLMAQYSHDIPKNQLQKPIEVKTFPANR